MFEEFTRPTNIIATTATWAANDIVLANGEIGLEVTTSNVVKIKAGNGVSLWSALSYVDIADLTINTATQTALDGKLALSGGTLTGPLVMAADPSAALEAATKQYVDAINSALTTTLAGKLGLSGGTMTGVLNLAADPTSALNAATKQYVDAGDDAAVKKSGSTMTGALVLAADPANAMEAVTKQYVDSGSYQTIVGGSSSYAGKVVKLNSFGFLDTSIVPILSTYIGTINLTASYSLTAVYTVGSYFSVLTTGSIDASWNTKINGAPTSCGAGQFLIFNLNGKWDLVGDATSSTAIASKLDKSGGTMTGFITLSADPTSALHAATKQYVDTFLPKTGGTLTGALTLAADPSANLQAATKQYVDTADALAALKANNLSDLASASTARTNLGATTTGSALFTTASASAARTTLGSTATGDALFTAASAAAGRSTLSAAASGNNTDITSVSLANTGLKLADTDASHTVSIVPSSNVTANRTISLATGDADRTLTISGNATVSQDYSTTGNPQFATIEVGNASDTTISRSAAGVIAVEGGVIPKENRANTFTAAQTISTGAATAGLTFNADAAQFKTITASTAGSRRWVFGSDNSSETGSNAGSNFFINSYTDGNVFISQPVAINRATGLTTLTSLNVPTIDLGNTDTTISRSSAGVIAVEGVTVPLNSITNTHTAQQIELGHASDTTITRVSAGNIAVEGSNVALEDRANTFTAAQTINQGASGATLNLSGDAGTNRGIYLRTAGAFRWIVFAHSAAESGSNAGSDLKIRRYSDAGVNLGDSINISRATGLTTLEALTVTGDITANGNCLVATTGGLGYGSGSGGTVTQTTSRASPNGNVTLNKTNGAITLVSAAGSTTWQSFTVTNSTVAATDTVVVSQKSGTDLYEVHVTAVAAGSFRISFRTTGGTTTEQPVFNFAVIKAVTA